MPERPACVSPLRFTTCPSGTHRVHPGLTCEQVGDREWDPVNGYRTDAEVAANPPQITGVLGLTMKES